MSQVQGDPLKCVIRECWKWKNPLTHCTVVVRLGNANAFLSLPPPPHRPPSCPPPRPVPPVPLRVPRAHSSSDLSRAGATASGREQWPLSMSPGSHSPPTGPGPAAQDTQGADPCARQLSSTEDASPVPAQDPTRPLLLPMMGVWLRSTLLTQPGTARGSGLEPASIKTG